MMNLPGTAAVIPSAEIHEFQQVLSSLKKYAENLTKEDKPPNWKSVHLDSPFFQKNIRSKQMLELMTVSLQQMGYIERGSLKLEYPSERVNAVSATNLLRMVHDAQNALLTRETAKKKPEEERRDPKLCAICQRSYALLICRKCSDAMCFPCERQRHERVKHETEVIRHSDQLHSLYAKETGQQGGSTSQSISGLHSVECVAKVAQKFRHEMVSESYDEVDSTYYPPAGSGKAVIVAMEPHRPSVPFPKDKLIVSGGYAYPSLSADLYSSMTTSLRETSERPAPAKPAPAPVRTPPMAPVDSQVNTCKSVAELQQQIEKKEQEYRLLDIKMAEVVSSDLGLYVRLLDRCEQLRSEIEELRKKKQQQLVKEQQPATKEHPHETLLQREIDEKMKEFELVTQLLPNAVTDTLRYSNLKDRLSQLEKQINYLKEKQRVAAPPPPLRIASTAYPALQRTEQTATEKYNQNTSLPPSFGPGPSKPPQANRSVDSAAAEWHCEFCTFINDNPYSTTCKMCTKRRGAPPPNREALVTINRPEAGPSKLPQINTSAVPTKMEPRVAIAELKEKSGIAELKPQTTPAPGVGFTAGPRCTTCGHAQSVHVRAHCERCASPLHIVPKPVPRPAVMTATEPRPTSPEQSITGIRKQPSPPPSQPGATNASIEIPIRPAGIKAENSPHFVQGPWQCQHCTLINDSDSRVCRVCAKTREVYVTSEANGPPVVIAESKVNAEIAKPRETEPIAVTVPRQLASTAFVTRQQCEECTHVQSVHTNMFCENCEAPLAALAVSASLVPPPTAATNRAPVNSHRESPPLPSILKPSPTPSVTPGSGDDIVTSWQCKHCTSFNNPNASICSMCNKKKNALSVINEASNQPTTTPEPSVSTRAPESHPPSTGTAFAEPHRVKGTGLPSGPQCEECEHIQSIHASLFCERCEAPLPAHAVIGSSVDWSTDTEEPSLEVNERQQNSTQEEKTLPEVANYDEGWQLQRKKKRKKKGT